MLRSYGFNRRIAVFSEPNCAGGDRIYTAPAIATNTQALQLIDSTQQLYIKSL